MPLCTFQAYVFNLHTTNSAEAKRLWRSKIKEEWDWECAYCGSDKKSTIDHIVPRAKSGTDFTKNVLCACHECNQDKAFILLWKIEYLSRVFLMLIDMKKLKNWMKPEGTKRLYSYGSRTNKIS